MMSDQKPPIAVKTFLGVSEYLNNHENRIADIEAVSIPAQKIWKWGRVFAPIGLGLIIASAGATSPLGKAAAAVRDTLAVSGNTQ
jgi:hypothetical protein